MQRELGLVCVRGREAGAAARRCLGHKGEERSAEERSGEEGGTTGRGAEMGRRGGGQRVSAASTEQASPEQRATPPVASTDFVRSRVD